MKLQNLYQILNFDKSLPKRYSRHYYDIYMFMNTKYKDETLKDFELLDKVIMFKNKFYRDSYSKYDEIKEGKLKLVPSIERIEQLKIDYKNMEDMLHGDIPSFDDILDIITKLEEEIRESIMLGV